MIDTIDQERYYFWYLSIQQSLNTTYSFLLLFNCPCPVQGFSVITITSRGDMGTRVL
jgi:hypothetical protein